MLIRVPRKVLQTTPVPLAVGVSPENQHSLGIAWLFTKIKLMNVQNATAGLTVVVIFNVMSRTFIAKSSLSSVRSVVIPLAPNSMQTVIYKESTTGPVK
mmetsp:Transcript_16734/g.34464  ORF Transcript_16734/g.34464 Transcript_16734/m.34464 type:complete len:99 (+) Transcript_16734:1187-1483(+)